MIKKEQKMKEAKKVCVCEDDCYLHIEVKNGICERLIAGGYPAMLHGLCGAIDRIGEKVGVPFNVVLTDIADWHKAMEKDGYKSHTEDF